MKYFLLRRSGTLRHHHWHQMGLMWNHFKPDEPKKPFPYIQCWCCRD